MTFLTVGQLLFFMQVLQLAFMLMALPEIARRGGLGLWVMLSMLVIGLASVMWIGRQVWA